MSYVIRWDAFPDLKHPIACRPTTTLEDARAELWKEVVDTIGLAKGEPDLFYHIKHALCLAAEPGFVPRA